MSTWKDGDEQIWEDPNVLEIIESIYDTNWVQLPRDFLLVMGLHEAYLLSHLIYVRRMMFRKNWFREKYKGWFFRKANKIEEQTHIKAQMQTKYFRKLKKRKFIKMRRAGRYAQRLFWIDFAALYRAIQEAKDGKDQ